MRIDGKQLAESILASLATEVATLQKNGTTPHLVVLLIGNDPASEAYVRQKKLKGESIGMIVTIHRLNNNVSERELLSLIQHYNNDENAHGIIVQQPLPEHVDVKRINEATKPQKDVDGFHTQSMFTPPIAEGVEAMLRWIAAEKQEIFDVWIKKQNVVVIGKGETGGEPIIQKFKRLGVDPCVIDSKTVDPNALKREADIIVSCVGKSRLVKANEIKSGVILFSIGMFRGEDGKLHGDYEEDEVKDIASFYTPVPGGVGPMNVAMLLKNVIEAAKKIRVDKNLTEH